MSLLPQVEGEASAHDHLFLGAGLLLAVAAYREANAVIRGVQLVVEDEVELLQRLLYAYTITVYLLAAHP